MSKVVTNLLASIKLQAYSAQVLVLRDTDLARRGTYHGLQPHQDEAEGYPLFA